MSATRLDTWDDDEPTYLVLFAAIIMVLNGSLTALWGLGAILNDEAVTVGGRGVVVWDFTTWGWVTLLLGLFVVAVAVGLMAQKGAARWAAVVLVMLHALSLFGMISAFPLFAILVIALDVLILYHLVAKWPRARPA